ELFNMLGITASNSWGMPTCGLLAKDYYADIVIAKRKHSIKKMDAFFALNPEDILMVIHKGNIRLFDEDLYEQLKDKNVPLNNFYKISIKGRNKYVYGNLPRLIESIRSY